MHKIGCILLFLLISGIIGCSGTSPAVPTTTVPTVTDTNVAPAQPTETQVATRPPIRTATRAVTPTALPSFVPLTPEPYAELGFAMYDISFCTGDGKTLKLDVYTPREPKRTPPPLLAYFHGNRADKSDVHHLEDMLKAGYAVASVGYRDAPEYRLPAPIEDAKCAIRFLRANAGKLGVDGAAVGAYGCSYGSYLAAMLGVNTGQQFEGKGGYADQSSRVQAVVDDSGFSDWVSLGDRTTAQYYFGSVNLDDPFFAQASPVRHVSQAAPPFLILHGDKDSSIPLAQAQELYAEMSKESAPVELLVVKNGEHCLQEGETDPPLTDVTQKMIEFFDRNLK